jgi:hypothetical protein
LTGGFVGGLAGVFAAAPAAPAHASNATMPQAAAALNLIFSP